ncbi:hypothetical protein L6R52_09210 [Myxococcota bacterium]|nr:hypothetical protein [Myxococcota bacterium]
MNRERLSTLSTRIGGFLGLAFFLVFGIKPAFVYGGLIGIVTASAIHGGPVGAELSTRIIVAGGMLMGVLAVGFILMVLGGVLGAAFDAFVFAPLFKQAEKAESEKTPAAHEHEAH